MLRKLSSLTALLLTALLALAVPTFATTETEALPVQTVFEETYLSEDYAHLIPFIFTSFDEFSFSANFFDDTHSYTPGYLYMKDTQVGGISLLLAVPLKEIGYSGNLVYYITEDNAIGQVDVISGAATTLVNASANTLWNLKVFGSSLYYLRNETVCRYSTITAQEIAYGTFSGIQFMYPITPETFYWENAQGEGFCYDITANTNVSADFATLPIGVCEADEAAATAVSAQSIEANKLQTLPLAEYPVGSYFTKNGSACNDHPCHYSRDCNCEWFGEGTQCEGFARYVFAQYAHLSAWAPSGHSIGTASFSSSAAAKTFLYGLQPGTYLRLNDTHSVIVMSTTSTRISIYEANHDGHCGVGTRTLTYSSFYSQYTEVTQAYAHDFGTYAKYNSTYHKVYGDNGSCNGYILEHHYAQTPGSNATCLGCGYVGNISNGVESVGGIVE